MELVAEAERHEQQTAAQVEVVVDRVIDVNAAYSAVAPGWVQGGGSTGTSSS